MDEEFSHGAITICFIDGSKMRFESPKQSKDAWDAMRKLQLMMERPYLCFETDDGLIVIPTANVKYVAASPKPAGVPEFFFRNTRLIDS